MPPGWNTPAREVRCSPSLPFFVELPRTPSEGSSLLADASLSTGLPGGRLCCVQRLRKTRRQPQVSGVVRHRVLQQEVAGRPDAFGGLAEVPHQLFEHGVFVEHKLTVHSRQAVGDRGYANFSEPRAGEVRSTLLPRTPVNSGKSKGRDVEG
ncbi:MAG: hypothetical protein AVDCRST_MAG01-01-294 [uncultured Rubrobacteraceae bacterium]|uniref:Uncharacterized protein n=1 Tax=uncultured Rubrobacteraceae bacterium TaxID=349277 RepID=A0A6J4NFZ1_9ACTN|nr:MAG: hypothetical protein AVDCRST_MAG01-01-294 [uncultured Rubrobacteraceae bacterium]